ncbi:2-hydroxy-acid oxidase, partial [Clostridium frigoris]|nr:2-hydroxy-acid oxidase [Clostridium frigoris]
MSYKKLDAKDIDFLVSILDKDRVFTGDDINDDFSHDEMGGISKMPEVLVEVLTTDEVSKIMKYA